MRINMSDFATTYAAALAAHSDLANSVHGRVVSRALADPNTPHHQRVLARAEEQTVAKYGTPGDWTEFWLVVERIAAVLSIIATLLMFLSPEPSEATVQDDDPHPGPHPDPHPDPPHPEPHPDPRPSDPWDGPHPHPPEPRPDDPPWWNPWHRPDPHPVWGSPFPYPDGTWGVVGYEYHFPSEQLAWEWIESQHREKMTMTPTPAEKQELTDKLMALVNGPPYNGDYNAVFAHYAGSDNLIDATGLAQLLTDASVGNWFTRSRWVSGIMAQLDTDHDGKLSLDEIKAAMPQPGV
jgi:hypothetical protein